MTKKNNNKSRHHQKGMIPDKISYEDELILCRTLHVENSDIAIQWILISANVRMIWEGKTILSCQE